MGKHDADWFSNRMAGLLPKSFSLKSQIDASAAFVRDPKAKNQEPLEPPQTPLFAVLEPLGIRKTKETRKGCALGLQRNQRNSKTLCSWASEKPKKIERAVGALGLQTNKRNSKPQCSWAACLCAFASGNMERPNKQNKDPR